MDNLTHGITGIGIGYLAQELITGPSGGLVICAFLASQFPDVDVIIGAKGKTAYLKHHRGFSHSVVLSPFYAAIIALLVKMFFPMTNYWHLFLVSFLSLGLHLFLDLLNAYGTKLLWPLSNQRFAWDILMIVDPLIILIFVVGIGSYIFTNYEEALFSVFPIFGLYILAMLKFRFKARYFLKRLFRNARLSLLPPLLGWRKWNFIVQERNSYYLGQVDAYTGKINIKEKLSPEEKCSSVLASMNEPDVQIFLDFARFPWYSMQEVDQDVVVKWSDLRYRLRERDHFCLVTKPKK